jgi:glucosamine--fructose-6-phosphate aminotransferase (isomerizing)
MCGIVGYIGDREAAPLLYQSLKRLEYRGYDSCGIATLDGGLQIRKGVGMIGEVDRKNRIQDLPGRMGIGHTRWATHGPVVQENAHPHLDCQGEIAIVHNGIVSNHLDLRRELEERGHAFRSETDTECIVHLIEEELPREGLEGALRKALSRIQGTYALLVLSQADPDRILCARKESPLLLGIGEEETFVGSDISAFLPFTRRAIPLDDGEYAVVGKGTFVVKSLETGAEKEKDVLEVDWPDDLAEKGGYAHFMLKEVFEQPETATAALSLYPEEIERLAEEIGRAERVYLVAAGSSLHASMIAEYWFSRLCGRVVLALDASELENKGIIDEETLVVGITQSGETYDTLSAMKYARSQGAKIAAIVNVIGSTATRLADLTILQGSGIEVSVCATKTFTSQLIVLLRTALALARSQGRGHPSLERELAHLPKLLEEVLRRKDEIETVAREYLTVPNYIFIGKGINLPSALEGALKLKEITYYHAEGMSSGMLKHGTISLIDPETYTIALVPSEGENRNRILSNLQEVKAREGIAIALTTGDPVPQCDANLVAPPCHELLSPLLLAPLYQLLAYYTALQLGRDVDKPRALAKSVTVE